SFRGQYLLSPKPNTENRTDDKYKSCTCFNSPENAFSLLGNSLWPADDVTNTMLVSKDKSSTETSSIDKTADLRPGANAWRWVFLVTASALPPSHANATVNGGPANPCNNCL
ncbi:hypothetical protein METBISCDRAFT_20416, partial [Metschnikowia bicuspidata]